MERINSVEKLNELLEQGHHDYFISLACGLVRSSKVIYKSPKGYSITNLIDDTEQDLAEKELFTHSNIGEAIKKNALVCEM